MEDHRLLGIEWNVAGAGDSGVPRRPDSNYSGEPFAGIAGDSLAWPGNPLCDGWHAVYFAEADRARRAVHVRIHNPSERHFFLSFTFTDAANDGPGRPFC